MQDFFFKRLDRVYDETIDINFTGPTSWLRGLSIKRIAVKLVIIEEIVSVIIGEFES